MAWHRDSIGLLFEKLLFSIIMLVTTVILSDHIEDRLCDILSEKHSLMAFSFYDDSTLYKIFIPLFILDIFLLLKVSFLII
jgi:hypothetical protein